MTRLAALLRHVILFVFPIPFLVRFAVEGEPGWPVYLAYAAAGVFTAAAIAAAVGAIRRNR